MSYRFTKIDSSLSLNDYLNNLVGIGEGVGEGGNTPNKTENIVLNGSANLNSSIDSFFITKFEKIFLTISSLTLVGG